MEPFRVDVRAAVAAGDLLGESCIWCPTTQKVWWLDIRAPGLHAYDPATGAHRTWPLPGRHCGNLALRRSGGFVLAVDNTLHGFDPESGAAAPLLALEPGLPENRLNDGRCDARGRLWIGTTDIAHRGPSGSLYRIEAGAARRMLGGLTIPNSTAFSPDGRTMYFADTPRHTIWAFDFDLAAGEISGRRVFADLTASGGYPDGSCVDAEGCLWNAQYGASRVVRYAPNGRIDRTIALPATNPTCCCFGGSALDTLYVTSARQELAADRIGPGDGALLALDPGVRGLPEHAFAG